MQSDASNFFFILILVHSQVPIMMGTKHQTPQHDMYWIAMVNLPDCRVCDAGIIKFYGIGLRYSRQFVSI